MHVTEITDPAELSSYRLLWKSLLAKTPGATFFQSLDWLEPDLRHHRQHQKLRVLVVRAGDEAVGIVPLVVRTQRTRLGPAQVLTYPLDHWGVFYGPIGPQPAATLTAALQYLRSRPRDWQMLALRWVHRDGSDRGRTRRAMRFVGWRPLEEIDQRGPAGDPRWDLIEACLQVARKSWQAGVDKGTTLSHGSVESYLRDGREAAARAGGLDLNLLLLDGRPAAFAYNYHYRGHTYGLRMGYDATVSRDGAGTVLMRRMLADGFERGDHT